MRMPKPVTVDFETMPIKDRPYYPPEPVGVSIKYWGRAPRYYGWGHTSGNNCTLGEALTALTKAWKHDDGILCHHGKFDHAVGVERLGLPELPWSKIHDTMYLIFLDEPHSPNLSLKPAGVYYLQQPPDERDEVIDWLVQHQPVQHLGDDGKYHALSGKPKSEFYAGAYIAFAPGDLVGRYANGDTSRTEGIFQLLWPKILEAEMLEAYDRERQLMPIAYHAEKAGVLVDVRRLRADYNMYLDVYHRCDAWIRKQVKVPDLNVDSGQQLAAAMLACGKADRQLMGVTDSGKVATNKDAITAGVTDKVLGAVLNYRARLKTCLFTFMETWLVMAEQSGGYIFTSWHTTRSDDGGARTGRLSSSPNFQNIPNEFQPMFYHQWLRAEEDVKNKMAPPPKAPFDVPDLPMIRSYVIPGDGELLFDRDYCFHPSTEVLTEEGWFKFDQLPRNLKLAQFNDGEITFEHPLAHQEIDYDADLVRIIGARSAELLVTPNHNCLLECPGGVQKFFRADQYKFGAYKQYHAGLYETGYSIEPWLLTLSCALQADAKWLEGDRVIFFFKKLRKVNRLIAALTAGKVEHVVNRHMPSKPGYVGIRFKLTPDLIKDLFVYRLSTGEKRFRRWSSMGAHSRMFFLEELLVWDGSKSPGKKYYGTTCEFNADFVQTVATLTGYRSVKHEVPLPSGKTFYTVALRNKSWTYTQTFTATREPYIGKVYCVTMPLSTVVVRLNGRVCVTGQSQQEPRLLAHFEGKSLLEMYTANPWVDVHDFARDEIERLYHKVYARKPVKNTNLGLIYGMGVGKLALKNNMPLEESKQLKKAVLALYPGLKDMYKDMKTRAKNNEPIRTWGGRIYYCEPAKLVNGRWQEFDYKMVNCLVQGSAADCTKEAWIRYDKAKVHGKLQIQVHDQLLGRVPIRRLKEEMEILRETMESVELSVPLLSEGKWSATNWADMHEYDKRGKVIYAK